MTRRVIRDRRRAAGRTAADPQCPARPAPGGGAEHPEHVVGAEVVVVADGTGQHAEEPGGLGGSRVAENSNRCAGRSAMSTAIGSTRRSATRRRRGPAGSRLARRRARRPAPRPRTTAAGEDLGVAEGVADPLARSPGPSRCRRRRPAPSPGRAPPGNRWARRAQPERLGPLPRPGPARRGRRSGRARPGSSPSGSARNRSKSASGANSATITSPSLVGNAGTVNPGRTWISPTGRSTPDQ